ncbi:hypothetical protein ACYOEI_02040 [Singulisphaera rosea]
MTLHYRQCHMEQPLGRATYHHTAWLPEKYAQLGENVKLLESNGSWSENWKVTFVSRTRLSEDVVRKAERAHLKQRQASDI